MLSTPWCLTDLSTRVCTNQRNSSVLLTTVKTQKPFLHFKIIFSLIRERSLTWLELPSQLSTRSYEQGRISRVHSPSMGGWDCLTKRHGYTPPALPHSIPEYWKRERDADEECWAPHNPDNPETAVMTEQWLVGSWVDDVKIKKCKSLGVRSQSQKVRSIISPTASTMHFQFYCLYNSFHLRRKYFHGWCVLAVINETM